MKKVDEFLQKNFRTLTKKEVDDLIKNLVIEYKEKYTRIFIYQPNQPLKKLYLVMRLIYPDALDAEGVYTRVKENNQSRDPQIHWIQVLLKWKRTRG